MKHEQRGAKTKRACKNCQEEFEALMIKVRRGGGVFCSSECHQSFRKKNKKNKKEADIFYQKKHKYGLTKEQYLGLLETQNNCCAICYVSFAEKKAFIDHCHVTLRVRGLLCPHCNTLLGMCNDNIDVLKKAIEYLGPLAQSG